MSGWCNIQSSFAAGVRECTDAFQHISEGKSHLDSDLARERIRDNPMRISHSTQDKLADPHTWHEVFRRLRRDVCIHIVIPARRGMFVLRAQPALGDGAEEEGLHLFFTSIEQHIQHQLGQQ